MEKINWDEILLKEEAQAFLLETEKYRELVMIYSCALREVKTKFEVLNDEFSIKHKRNPIETIKTRIKDPKSIFDKLKRKNLSTDVQTIKNEIHDVAGVRIVCSFIEDIYSLVDMLRRQDDIVIVNFKDYIEHPKENGYRSVHLLVQIPIFLSDHRELVMVEVQIRTIAMDFWASLDHKLRYKKDSLNSDEISKELKDVAFHIAELDNRMQDIRKKIDKG